MSRELVDVTVTLRVSVFADFVREERAPGWVEMVFDDLDVEDVISCAKKKLDEGDFDYEVEE